MPRKLSKIQLSDKTNIAGEKLDALWQDISNRFDLLDISDIKTKFLEDQLVFGYRPRVVNWEPDGLGTGHPDELPWLPGKSPRFEHIQFKGNDFPGINPNGYGGWYNWGISWHTGEDPQVVTEIDFVLDQDLTGTYYSNEWQWVSNMPPGIDADDFVEDFGFELVVDHPLDPSNPSSNTVEVYRCAFSASAQYMPPLPVYGSAMSPSFPGGDFSGVWVRAEELNIPIPSNSRVRLLMTIPNYSGSLAADGTPITTGDVKWMTSVLAPFALNAYSGSVTILLPKDAKKD